MISVYIIILNWNGKKDTLECLASLRKVSSSNFQTLVVDNGSSDDSADAIRHYFPEVTVLETGENLGFAEGNNVGIRYALDKEADFVFLLNNDTVVDPQILHAFLSHAGGHQHAGIWGAKIYLYSDPKRFDHLGGKWDSQKGAFTLLALRQEDDGKWDLPIECDYACGAALFIKREVFETIGLLEPKFFLIWEEADFCFRARKAGFATFFCPEAKIWHKVSASFVGGKPHTDYFWWRNRLLWIARNCSAKEKRKIFLRVIFPESVHLLKLFCLKSLQLFIAKFFTEPQKSRKKREKIAKYRAALAGMRDYLAGRFGNAPNWIYKNRG